MFGVEAISPAPEGEPNFLAHMACAERGITHMECLAHLDELIGRGRFRFIGFPLKIRGGTASPIRTAAVFECMKPDTLPRPSRHGADALSQTRIGTDCRRAADPSSVLADLLRRLSSTLSPPIVPRPVPPCPHPGGRRFECPAADRLARAQPARSRTARGGSSR